MPDGLRPPLLTYGGSKATPSEDPYGRGSFRKAESATYSSDSGASLKVSTGTSGVHPFPHEPLPYVGSSSTSVLRKYPSRATSSIRCAFDFHAVAARIGSRPVIRRPRSRNE